MILYNQEYIVKLFREYLNIELSESDFKANGNDLSLYFNLRGRSFMIEYDDFKEEYVLKHLNRGGNRKEKYKYHRQWGSKTLGGLIGGYLVTLHDAKDLNTKKSSLDKLIDSVK